MNKFSIWTNSSSRYKLEKKVWYVQIPIAYGLFQFENSLWSKLSIFYLVFLSIWALASTADGNEEAAKSREALDDSTNETD